MASNTDLMLYLVFGLPLAVVAFYVLLLGPLGWVSLFFLALGGMAVRSLRADAEDRTPERENCSNCGSPNPIDAATCEYCGAGLSR